MKLKSFINNAEVIELNKNINSKIYFELKSLIRNENSDSLLSKLSDKLLKEYLSYCSISNYFYLYVCLLDNKIIGYSIFVKNYKIQKNDFFFLSFKILLDQLLKFNLIPLLNFFLIITNLENILINKSNLNLINTSLNLNLLAIKKNYQSKGIGQFFIKSCLKNIKKK